MAGETTSLTTFNLILTGTSSSLSIIGAVLIFWTYFTMREIQNFTRKLLVYLTLADLFTAVGNLIAVVRYAYVHGDVDLYHFQSYNRVGEFMCWTKFLTTFSNLSSFIWTVIIAIHLWSTVILKRKQTEVYYMHALYHVISWILPLIIVLILLHKKYLGEDYCFGTGVWCGIKSNLPRHEIEIWMYIADIAWQITCYLTASFLYIHMKYYLKLYYKGRKLATVSDRLRNEDENFVFVWMVIYLLKLWGFTRFFITTYSNADALNKPSMKHLLNFLLLMQSYGASGQAFWNCILFCFLDKTVRRNMKTWLKCRDDGEERGKLLGDLSTQNKTSYI